MKKSSFTRHAPKTKVGRKDLGQQFRKASLITQSKNQLKEIAELDHLAGEGIEPERRKTK